MRLIRPRLRAAAFLAIYFIIGAGVAAGQNSAGNDGQGDRMALGSPGEIKRPSNQDIASNPDADYERPISLRSFGSNFVQDQIMIWKFPAQVAHGEHWKQALGVAAATGALIALDPRDEPYFVNSSGFKGFKTGPLSGLNTGLAIASVPLTAYVVGRARKDVFSQNSALLAAESIADTEIVTTVLKAATGRRFPEQIPSHGDFTHTWLKYDGTLGNPGSFPSGHAAAAFATASVFASCYRQHRWVPWLAYSAASFVALSRLPDRAHFPSDIFVGAALGYAVGHYVVAPLH